MATLSREDRRLLENAVAHARKIAEDGARKVLLDQYAVHHHEPWPHMTTEERTLRNQLRAHGRQLGDRQGAARETQDVEHLAQACAYEHWHRMLFARFLAENDLLLDAEHGMAMTLEEVRELARERNREWVDLAAELAQRMLLAVFRPDDPVLRVTLPPETRQHLEEKLTALPAAIFRADDSLGWVYQFWQRDEKDRVNKSEVKIGADELPAVTQLFTEDYMVLFLLENTLGAWWTAKRRAEGKHSELSGFAWTYLRLTEDGSPAAGGFDGWPRAVRDLRILDPCMGSGHFLIFALPILVRMRIEEEQLSLREAIVAVLRDNLFGLEIDARCSQIAAFNLALASWRLAGEHLSLPQLNLACSGLGINASETDWIKLAGDDFAAHQWMRRLYALFKDGPTLGSLVDPSRFLERGEEAGFERILPLMQEGLQREQLGETRELAIAAQGVLAAFRILADRFTLVVTNVPYLGRGKQDPTLAEYCAEFHSDAKADLATCFVDRCLRFCSDGGSTAVVTPQNWLFLTTYTKMRKRLLTRNEWNLVVRLGPAAFQDMNWWAANTSLLVLSNEAPLPNRVLVGIDVSGPRDPLVKAQLLVTEPLLCTSQASQLGHPDHRILLQALEQSPLLEEYAACFQGVSPADFARYGRFFWELAINSEWRFWQSTVNDTVEYGGRELILWWGEGLKEAVDAGSAFIRGEAAWGNFGVVVRQMRHLPCTIYTGEIFDTNCAVISPRSQEDLLAIWSFCSSDDYSKAVRQLDQKTNVTNATLVKVPVDITHWRKIAAEKYPNGLPKPHSDDPTQWLFNGHPKGSKHPLQVAVARLVGYRWPRQTGSTFPDCPALGPDGLEKNEDADGIVCLNSLAGETAASDRLRVLLSDAYGGEWSASKLQQLLGDCESLEEWLRDRFFEEHCAIFDQRPFVWHVWDGRNDGFHALVNYHRVASPDGEGRKTLEKLIYTMLGDWIQRQQDEVKVGKEGADARLAAARHLQSELEKILAGEKPYDIFVRWKPLEGQPIGWQPDINDGVRLNIRPWLAAKPYQPSRRDACILRATPRINYGKDRGKEPHRSTEHFPWLWSWDERSENFAGRNDFDGARWNDLHYSLSAKGRAREKKQEPETDLTQARETKV
jgi:hypothetical protein